MFNTIEKIGNKLGIDLKFYSKNGIILLITLGISEVTSLIKSVFLASFFTTDQYGIYKYIFSVIGLISLISIPGINTAIKRAAAIENGTIYIKATIKRFKWSFLGFIPLVIFSIVHLILGEFEISLIFLLISFLFPFYYSFETFKAFLIGRKNYLKFTIMIISSSLIVNLLPILFLYYFDIIFVIISFILLQSIIYCVFFLILRSRLKKEKKISENNEETIRYGVFMTKIETIFFFRNYLDYI
jgi:O-antigen/teichoic acid export membrane protein